MTQAQQRLRQQSFGEQQPEAQDKQGGERPSRHVDYSTSTARHEGGIGPLPRTPRQWQPSFSGSACITRRSERKAG
jgi:hypothetical protein